MPIKLLVACRDPTLASSLCTKLIQVSGGEIAGEAMEITGVLQRAAATQPDVLLLEHATDQEKIAWDVLAQLERASPATRVLLLCDVYTNLTIIGSIQRGARGCLLKSSDPWLHVKAVSSVHQGEPWFGRTALLEALRSQMAAEPATASALLEDHELLTAREREILALAGSALSNKEIARQLNISDKTVKTHLHHIYVKLHKSGRYKLFLSNFAAVDPSRLGTPDRFH